MNRELVVVDRRKYLEILNTLESDKFYYRESKILGLNSIFYLEVDSNKVLAQAVYFPAGINEYRINKKFKEIN
jgi:hypothetical protein